MQTWPMKWDLLARYRLIEIVALWEGRLTTNHLMNSFGMGRQQASKDIRNYREDVAPGNLEYDSSLKGYKPAEHFSPVLTTGSADEYLHVMSRSQDLRQTFHGLDLGFAHSEILTPVSRSIEPQVLRPILQGIREQKRVEIDYVSLSSPDVETRVIAPHSIVYTPLRWHVRAFCEKNKDYRDFVLSRFRAESDVLLPSDNTVEQDVDWNTEVDVVFTPDPRLTKAQQAVIEHDYGMKSGMLVITTRAALVKYVLQAYGIDTHKIEPKAEAQQIVLANADEIKGYVFG
ncbi:helix-turn-helix transcriptional regulator [Salinibius halmophilus]|uniref:helix-turn-helix transcriptional regulator n=1 Tax=Salinibius halmophilus TaxID=1853216 RepID=UPI000E67091B|nr:WYL domain-containing protein [Salinibius halmophilus]